MTRSPYIVDNTDWLKAAAIILVTIDHFGYFFIESADWWSVAGRLAAPPFFFMIGYARSRTIPLRWIGLGIALTLLDSWNNDWDWMALNILISYVLIRMIRPKVQNFLKAYQWLAFVTFIGILLALLPLFSNIFDYGAAGWLWALLGLCQRMYLERRSLIDGVDTSQRPSAVVCTIPESIGLMRLLACFVAAVVYLWHEQIEFSFTGIQFTVFLLGTCLMSWSLCLFQRAPSRIQPGKFMGSALHFIGRHTLELYAIPLAGFELIIGLIPQLAG